MRPAIEGINIFKRRGSLIYLTTRASICHKSELPKPCKPFDYESRQWRFPQSLLDPLTKRRFTENTKIVTIEGNVHCGKHDLAKRLADQLGMKYMPEIDLNKQFVTGHGFDLRALNPMLPERLRLCDWEMFHENPTRHSSLHLIFIVYKLRLLQYILALQHIFNTGQGVVMARSVFSDRVFVDAMHEIGWLPTGYNRADGARFYDFRHHYIYYRMNTVSQLLRPHLTIYLDTPIETCLNNIKNSKNPSIANSNALVPEFLEAIKNAYDSVTLPRLEAGGHILSYDYEERASDAEIMDIVDDIKNLDFEFDNEDSRFQTWRQSTLLWYISQRYKFTTLSGVVDIMKKLYLNNFDIAGLGDSINQLDLALRNSLFQANLVPLGVTKYAHRDVKYAKSYFHALTGLGQFHTRLTEIVCSDSHLHEEGF